MAKDSLPLTIVAHQNKNAWFIQAQGSDDLLQLESILATAIVDFLDRSGDVKAQLESISCPTWLADNIKVNWVEWYRIDGEEYKKLDNDTLDRLNITDNMHLVVNMADEQGKFGPLDVVLPESGET